jgi:hypothetical protein
MMTKEDYIAQVEYLTVDEIVEGIFKRVVKFKELKHTEEFAFSKQKAVRAILNKMDDTTFASCNTIDELQSYLEIFDEGRYTAEAKAKILDMQYLENEKMRKKKEREGVLKQIEEDINEYTVDEISTNFGDEVLDEICEKINFDRGILRKYKEPELKFGGIPTDASDIPENFTDVFFWGIPSSGKTCALSAILSTMDKKYTISDPLIPVKFGTMYRNNLINNIFINDKIGYLPDSTMKERTQYMPFLLKRRIGEKLFRKISFFELSGEVFKYFYDKVYNTSMTREADTQAKVEIGFNTLDLLLNSKNQKIHFFFIDYNQETKGTKDKHGLTQSNYLQAAATYFRDNHEIFKKKTDAVYVIVTKSDQIKEQDKELEAAKFLEENFGGFMDVLKTKCKNDDVEFRKKLFSIGNVYFKRICEINRDYSMEIIEDLLNKVKPVSDSKFRSFFNS